MEKHKAGLEENGHGEKGAIMKTCGGLPELKWASKKKVSEELAKQLVALLGEEVILSFMYGLMKGWTPPSYHDTLFLNRD